MSPTDFAELVGHATTGTNDGGMICASVPEAAMTLEASAGRNHSAA
jgi:hypothetical protein